jgi:hypothetical protein
VLTAYTIGVMAPVNVQETMGYNIPEDNHFDHEKLHFAMVI